MAESSVLSDDIFVDANGINTISHNQKNIMSTQTPIDKNKRKAWRLKAEAKLETLQADINKLEAKAKEASADGRLKFESVKKDLSKRRSQIEKNLEELKESQNEKWDSIKSKAEAALNDMHDAYNKAKDRFRS